MFTLSLIAVICATENNIHSYNTAMNQLASNPNSENIEIAQPRNEIPQHDFNYIPNDNTQSLFNTNSFEDDKIESILNTLFFSLVKRNLSFILYNISILREIFAHINNMAQVSQLNMQNLKDLLFSSSSLFKVHVMRQIFEMNYPIEEEQQNYLIKCCKGYLSVYNINYDGLSLLELKEKVYATNPFFRLNYYDFIDEYSFRENRVLVILNESLDLANKNMTVAFLGLCNLIYDTILVLHSFASQEINKNLYPVLKDECALFGWAFEFIFDFFASSISLALSSGNSTFFYFSDVQLCTCFILSLFKIVQSKQIEGIFFHFMFFFQKISLFNDFPDNESYSPNHLISILRDLFIQFSNEIANKRTELEQLELQNPKIDIYDELIPIIHKFFKTLIVTFRSNYLKFVQYEQK